MLATATISFNDAARSLKRKLQVNFELASFCLDRAKLALEVYLAYQRLYPDDFREKLKKHMLPFRLGDLRDGLQAEHLQNNLIDAVGALFPIDMDATDMNWHSGDEMVVIIESQNMSMSWDEFNELLENPENLAGNRDSLAFPMLIWSMGQDLTGNAWKTLSKYLGWNTKCPDYGEDTYIDMVALRARLRKHNLEPFETAILVAWKDTGNYFIDFDPYDETNYEPLPPFNADTLCDLAQAYRQALPILDEYGKAMKILRNDPTVFDRLTRLMEQSFVEREAR